MSEVLAIFVVLSLGAVWAVVADRRRDRALRRTERSEHLARCMAWNLHEIQRAIFVPLRPVLDEFTRALTEAAEVVSGRG